MPHLPIPFQLVIERVVNPNKIVISIIGALLKS
jgi:hypothetical protein